MADDEPPPQPQHRPPEVAGQGPVKRSGSVTIAAVIAFLCAALGVPFVWIGVAGADRISPWQGALFVIISVITAALLVWGAIAALKGRTNTILLFTAVALFVADLIATVAAIIVTRRWDRGVGGLLISGAIIYFLLKDESAQFFKARGGAS